MDGGVLADRGFVGERFPASSGHGRDFGGTRLRQRYIAEPLNRVRERVGARDQWVDLVNGDVGQQCSMSSRANVTSRDKNLIQPESLILAQSERWRRA